MHAVVLEIAALRVSRWVDKEAVEIQVFGIVLSRDLGKMTVGVLDDVVADPGEVNRQDALDHDRGFFVPRGQVSHDLSVVVRDEVLLHGDIVDAGHEEDGVGVAHLRTDPVPPRKQAFDRLAGDAEVGHGVIGKAPLPVEPLGQGVADENEVFGHLNLHHGDTEVLDSRLVIPSEMVRQ